ncbi:MAG: hypothetical protein WBL31_14570 [Ilumatobacteraceae bacterium]
MTSQRPVRDQLGDLRTRQRRFGSTLRIHGPIAIAATIAAHLGIDRATMPTQQRPNHLIGITSLDPCTNLFAFMQRQWSCWHAGTSTGRVV